MNYHVVEQTSKKDFEIQCSKWIAMGYEPVGNMTAETGGYGFLGMFDEPETTYRQAFVKKTQNETTNFPPLGLHCFRASGF